MSAELNIVAQEIFHGWSEPHEQRHEPSSKGDFKIDLRAKTITCPAGEVELFEPGDTVQFDPEACGDSESRRHPSTDSRGGVARGNHARLSMFGAL